MDRQPGPPHRRRDLAACATLDGLRNPQAQHNYVIGLDVGVKHDRTAMAVCHAEPWQDGRRVLLDRMTVWTWARAGGRT